MVGCEIVYLCVIFECSFVDLFDDDALFFSLFLLGGGSGVFFFYGFQILDEMLN